MYFPELIVIVRHGESRENRIEDEQITLHGKEVGVVRAGILIARYADCGDPPITLNGKLQSEITGKWLKRQYGTFDVFFVSSLQRTHQTMEALAPRAEYTASSLLDEFTLHACTHDCGSQHLELPKDEWEADIRRVHEFFGELCSGDYAGKRVLIAGHGNWIAAARRHPHPSMTMLPGGEQEPVENASVSTFRKIVDAHAVEGSNRIHGSQLSLDRTMVVPWKSPARM